MNIFTTTTPVKTTVTGLNLQEMAALRTALVFIAHPDANVELGEGTAVFHGRDREQATKLLRKRLLRFRQADGTRAGLQSVIERMADIPDGGRTVNEQINEMADDLPALVERLTASVQHAQLASIYEMLNISLATTDAAIELTRGLRENNPDDQWVTGLLTQLEALSEHTDHLQENVKEFIREPDTDSK